MDTVEDGQTPVQGARWENGDIKELREMEAKDRRLAMFGRPATKSS